MVECHAPSTQHMRAANFLWELNSHMCCKKPGPQGLQSLTEGLSIPGLDWWKKFFRSTWKEKFLQHLLQNSTFISHGKEGSLRCCFNSTIVKAKCETSKDHLSKCPACSISASFQALWQDYPRRTWAWAGRKRGAVPSSVNTHALCKP